MLDKIVLQTVRNGIFERCKRFTLLFWCFIVTMTIKHESGKSHRGFTEMIPYHIAAAMALDGKPSSIHSIALKTGYHFTTVKRYLLGLCKEGIVETVPSENVKYRLVEPQPKGEATG